MRVNHHLISCAYCGGDHGGGDRAPRGARRMHRHHSQSTHVWRRGGVARELKRLSPSSSIKTS